jgi:hypothetical protein
MLCGEYRFGNIQKEQDTMFSIQIDESSKDVRCIDNDLSSGKRHHDYCRRNHRDIQATMCPPPEQRMYGSHGEAGENP